MVDWTPPTTSFTDEVDTLIPTPHLSLWKCSLEINQIIEQHTQSNIFWTPKCVQQIPKCSWQILDMPHHRSIAPSFAFCHSGIQTNRGANYFKRNTKQMQLENTNARYTTPMPLCLHSLHTAPLIPLYHRNGQNQRTFCQVLLPAHSDLIGIAFWFQSGRTKLNLQVPVVVPSHPVVGTEPVYVQLLLHPFEHVKCLARQEMSRMVIPEVTPSLPTGSYVLRVLTSGTLIATNYWIL